MPHIVVEASRNDKNIIEELKLVEKLHLSLAHDIDISKIKSRSIYSEESIVGESKSCHFIHVTISLLSGRTELIRQQLGGRLFKVLSESIKNKLDFKTSISLEVREMNSNTYFK